MSISNDSKQAFTLLEVMIALTVLAVGMFAVFSAMGVSANASRNISEQELVSQALENRMEQIQSGIWTDVLEDFMGDSAIRGVHQIDGNTPIIKTTFAKWVEDDGAGGTNYFDELSDPRKLSNWDGLNAEEKEQEWSAIRPGDFDILLVSLRADWAGAVGNQVMSMEFVLVDRDGNGN